MAIQNRNSKRRKSRARLLKAIRFEIEGAAKTNGLSLTPAAVKQLCPSHAYLDRPANREVDFDKLSSELNEMLATVRKVVPTPTARVGREQLVSDGAQRGQAILTIPLQPQVDQHIVRRIMQTRECHFAWLC